jgi:hypothetical protein
MRAITNNPGAHANPPKAGRSRLHGQFRPDKTTSFRRLYQDFGRFLEDFGRVSSRHPRLRRIPGLAALRGRLGSFERDETCYPLSIGPALVFRSSPLRNPRWGPLEDLGLSAGELPHRRTYRRQLRTRSTADVAFPCERSNNMRPTLVVTVSTIAIRRIPQWRE